MKKRRIGSYVLARYIQKSSPIESRRFLPTHPSYSEVVGQRFPVQYPDDEDQRTPSSVSQSKTQPPHSECCPMNQPAPSPIYTTVSLEEPYDSSQVFSLNPENRRIVSVI